MTRKYGCWNTERQPGYWVRSGTRVEHQTEVQMVRRHHDTMSRECQYRIGMPNDPRCEGCLK